MLLASFLQRPGLPFADALAEDASEKAFDDEDASFADDEDAVYTPAITLSAFLSPVLFKDELRSCVAAVARVIVGALNCGFRIADWRGNVETPKRRKVKSGLGDGSVLRMEWNGSRPIIW